MNKKIKIRITKDGKVEVDSTVYTDCKDVADKLKKLIGTIEEFVEKEETGLEEEGRIKIETDK
ncbi:MAG: hypothetical protein V3T96_05965 [Thermodesulfobacteriota bacterium]